MSEREAKTNVEPPILTPEPEDAAPATSHNSTAKAVELPDASEAPATAKTDPAEPVLKAADNSRPEELENQNRGLAKIAQYHFAAAMAAFTLFGAGDVWAVQSGLWLASAVSVANGLIAGVVLAYLIHEWSHFSGARLAGARSPTLKEPRSFFMFNFDMERNSISQFLTMSLGGPLGNWLLVLALWWLLPLNTAGQAMFFAAASAIAISVSIFEIPVINRTRAGGNPGKELAQRLESGALTTGRNIGIAAGVVLFLIVS